MRGWTKALLWIGILLACAAVGAFIASRTDPFPPGVPDPGALASETPSPTPEEPNRWSLRLMSRTTHTYRVGGSCTSDWRMDARIRVPASGRIAGRGVATLLPGAGCDFPSAQVQARRVVIAIEGRRDRADLVIRFRPREVRPVGSQDLGGFLATLETLRFSLPERAGAGASKPARVEEPEGEIHAAVTTVRLRA